MSSAALAQTDIPIPHPRISRPGDANITPNVPNPTGPDLLIPDTTDTQTPILDTPDPAQPISLSAKIQEDGTVIPDGLIWRVYDTQTDGAGQLALLFKSEDATAALSLPPGEYLVHVAYGRAQSSDTLLVEPGPNIKTIILDAGALRLRSAISAEINIPPAQLKFDILATGLDGDQIPVVQGVEQNTMVHLNAGVYNVVSRWGDQNATVRADIRVEPGQVTEATLFHKAAQVTFLLVSSAGGEAIADVDWKVMDENNETLFTHLGAFPASILAEGDYTVIAQSGDAVYNRQFQVQSGRPLKVEVLTTVY